MNPNDFRSRPHFYQNEKYVIMGQTSLNRKRQIINQTLAELHTMQLDMIDQAVEFSDLSKAQEVINHIRSL